MQNEAAADQRHRQLDLGERGPQVGRHVVGALVLVAVGGALGRQAREVILEVAGDVGVGVLLDQQAGRGVAAEEGEQAGGHPLTRRPAGRLAGDFVQPLPAGADLEGVGRLPHQTRSRNQATSGASAGGMG